MKAKKSKSLKFVNLYSDRGVSSKALASMTYTNKEEGIVKKNINLTEKEEIPKYSAIPPQTP